jgi:polyphosphate:AMP phosphotransferase
MFEAAEAGQELEKDEYQKRAPELRTRLLGLQQRLLGADFPVIVLVNGVDGAGKGETVNLLLEWMDARWVRTYAFDAPTEEERQRPEYWRFWMALPQRGRVGIFFGSWYTAPILGRAYHEIGKQRLERALDRINAFEKTLCADGALFVKLWFHVSKKRQKQCFRELEKKKATRWRVSETDWEHHRLYDRFVRICERVLSRTSTPEAPWQIVDGADARHREIAVASYLAERLEARLAASNGARRPEPLPQIANPRTLLDDLDLSKSLSKQRYEKRLERLQGRLHRLARHAEKAEIGTTLVFEGSDAAGKGGAIRRLTHALDARRYRVIPIAAPTDEERAHHWLWRFWRHLPRLGRFTLYDRSWYGRVLVERVEGFASEAEWRRAYAEIRDFEAELVEHGLVLCKFWLQVSPAEQLRRFEERGATPYKQYKLTPDDLRNRERMNQYELAAAEMIARTSTEDAPWTLVEADDKRWARIKVVETVCDRLEAAL